MKSTKKRILEAASELLVTQGPAGMSVRAIATKAGISTIGIYSHFEGKQGVLNALYMDGFERVYEAMSTARLIKDPHDALMDGVTRYFHLSQAHEAQYRLIFGETDLGFEPSVEAREAGRKAFDCFVSLVAKLLPAAASEETKQIVALRIWAQLHGYVSLQHHAVKYIVSFDDWMPIIKATMEETIEGILSKQRSKA